MPKKPVKRTPSLSGRRWGGGFQPGSGRKRIGEEVRCKLTDAERRYVEIAGTDPQGRVNKSAGVRSCIRRCMRADLDVPIEWDAAVDGDEEPPAEG